MIDTIVIDFGTSRTKAAYYNPKSQQPTLIRLGERDYVPSVFYVEKGGNILFGDAAQDVLEDQKVGSRKDSKPIRGLKLELSRIHRRRGKSYSAADMLTPLFTRIRESAASLEGFDKTYSTKVVLTTTKLYRPSDREMLQRAAQNAGFKDISLIAEPESVAKGWVTATEPDRTDVIVLDCGGGTVDWTYLHRGNRNFRVMPNLAGGAAKIGGHAVDKALARILDPGLERDPRLLNKVCDIKEMFCEGIDIEELPPISIGSQSVKLDGTQIDRAICEAFINPVCEEIEPFIEKVKKATRRGNPAILLVGGSAKLRGLKDELELRFECDVNPDWPDAEYAPVLGAVPTPASGQAPEVSISSSGEASEERLDRQLVRHFREVATLIGERQDSEVEFVVDEDTHRVVPGLNISSTHKEKLRGRADRLDRGSLRLTVLGGVSTGKSTLINTMIGQGMLPTGEGACTSVPIEIVHGSNGDRATIVERGGKSRSIPFEEFKETYCFTSQEQPKVNSDSESTPVRPERFEGVEYVQLESESTLCKKGIRFVDTLGVNADELSDDITSRFIAETDTILVVMGKDLLPKTTCTFIREFAEAKACPGVSGYEHVFFVLQNPGTWDQYEDRGDRKQAEASLRGQLEGLHFDGNLYNSRVFIVNSLQAFFARTKQEYRHKLEKSGILEFEEALFKFMEGTDRVLVVTESAVNQAFIPVLDEARRYISGKQEFLDKDAAEQRLRETRKGLGELKEAVKECRSIAREFVEDIQDKIIREYRYIVEDELSDEDFKDHWEEQKLEDYLEAEKLTAEKRLESESKEYIKKRFSSAIKRVSTQYPLGTMVQDALTPRAVEFFDTLGRISPYQTSAAGILDDVKRFEIQIGDAFTGSFDMPSISLIVQEKRWFQVWKNPAKKARKDILRQLDDAREALTEGERIEHIKGSIDEQVSDVTNTLVTRLNSEIEAVERQLNDAYNMAGHAVVEKKRLKKIAFLLTAKYEEISRAVFGRVLNLEELRARVAQSRQAEADA